MDVELSRNPAHGVFFDNRLELFRGPFKLKSVQRTLVVWRRMRAVDRPSLLTLLFLVHCSPLRSYDLKHLRPCIRALAKAEMSNVRINSQGQLDALHPSASIHSCLTVVDVR